jgi:hypothetical protein
VLGAVPGAAYARRRLRELGTTSVPRGPNAATSTNPAHLTERELDVLRLVANGLSNADVAGACFCRRRRWNATCLPSSPSFVSRSVVTRCAKRVAAAHSQI